MVLAANLKSKADPVNTMAKAAAKTTEILTEERPWGKFERFTLNEPCTVKLIYVSAGKRLSLQFHNDRSEFWKIVKGPVRVQVNDKKSVLQTGDTISIPRRAKHRLEGMQDDGIVLEISFGNFDESDIVRLEDDYKRVS